MQVGTNDTRNSVFEYRVLACALAAIPLPIASKELVVVGKETIVRERVLFSDVTFAELLSRIAVIDPGRIGHRDQLIAALAVLESLGIVTVQRFAGTDQPLEQTRISATSEQAGYLLHSLSKFMANLPYQKSPIRPDSSITGFHAVLEAALKQERINPHLLLAILLERGRKGADEDPLRITRVISVLVKGERVKADSNEIVYLHVRKPDWDSYALIGSVQREGEEIEQTARLALEEDLRTPAHLFVLKQSGVEDDYDSKLSITHGVYTRYAFNLFVVEALHGELTLRDDLEYAWFTFEEICNQKSRIGQPIITRARLLQRLDKQRGLDSMPVVVKGDMLLPAPSFRRNVREIKRDFADVFKHFWGLAQLIWIRMLSIKWWLILLLAAVVTLVILGPIIDQKIPALSNIADILGIVGFVVSVAGIFAGGRRRKRSEP